MPNPTNSTSWPQQQAINRMIESDIREITATIAALSAAITALAAAIATLQADIDTLQGEIDDLIDYLGNDCAGGDCGSPPFGECTWCNSGTTRARYVLNLGGIDLTARSTNPTDWENYFNGSLFELEQTSACVFTFLDDTTAEPDYAGGVTLNSVKFTLTISNTAWFLDIVGYANNDGTGTSTTLLQVYTASDTAGTGYDPNTCNDISGASYWYRNGTSQNWNVPGSDEIPDFTIGLAGATITSPHQ